MKLLRVVNWLLLALVIFSLLSLYSFATWSYKIHGQWPQYGRPESWSSPPFNLHEGLFLVFLMLFYFLYQFIWIAVASAVLQVLSLAYLRVLRIHDLAMPACLLLASLLYWSDPFGALNWYVD